MWGKEKRRKKKAEEEEVPSGRGVRTKLIGKASLVKGAPEVKKTGKSQNESLPAHGTSEVSEKRLVLQLGGYQRWQNLPTARGP